MSQHHATFTWGAGPNSVHIAGGFNNWSATASPLHKQQDGTFKADLPVPWGEKQAFKYVVDGDWKVREDEAKEWDAAGNMNNVYTAPPAPTDTGSEHSKGPIAAAAAAVTAPVAAVAAATHHNSTSTSAPASRAVEPAAEPAPVPAIAKAEPSNLMAASAPSAASNPLFSLGKPVSEVKHADLPVSDTKFVDPTAGVPTTVHTSAPVVHAPVEAASITPATAPVTAPVIAPVTAVPASAKSLTPAETIEKTAASANVGEASTAPHEESYLEKATHLGAGALAGLGAYVAVAAGAVEKVTGIDLTHGQPLTIEEAKAKGVDLNEIQKRDAPTDAVSPVGTKPPSAAVDDLARKVEDLKVGSVSKLDKVEPKANDIPAQHEATDNHKTVPMPVITAISDKDPKKDRTLDGASPAGNAKPIGADPSISAKVAKVESEVNPGKNAATLTQAHTAEPVRAAPTPAAVSNINTSSTPAKDTSGIHTAPTTSLGQAPAVPSAVPAAPVVVAPAAAAPVPAAAAPVPAAAAPVPAAAPPTTPAKNTNKILAQAGTPGSLNSTPASTPVKAAHGKEGTAGSDVRKRKSSFFHKLKTAFSPKDKEKK